MINIETRVSLPFLWGKPAFKKSLWSHVNLIVGPNGSGKTLLAGKIAAQFQKSGYEVNFFHADQIEEDKVLSLLRENPAVRAKIESVLSDMFEKSIRFEKSSDGTFVPVVINKTRGVEYNLREGECHGLKEILSLFAVLYGGRKSRSKRTCFVFDEPELHLHPQMQMFFMGEIRRVAVNAPDSVFFLITHSPFFIDLRFPDDLLGVVVCHINHAPTSIEKLSENDTSLFQRFLPRFNTYHKQFFFSDRQIFVEGYTDQQIFSILLSTFGGKDGATGTGVIDVGGKDELGVFFKVCSLLGTDGRIIADLDSLFRGKLRDVLCDDPRPARWLKKQNEKQLNLYRLIFPFKTTDDGEIRISGPVSLKRLITRLEAYLSDVGNTVLNYILEQGIVSSQEKNTGKPGTPSEIFLSKIEFFSHMKEKLDDLDTFKTVILQAVFSPGVLDDILPEQTFALVPRIRNLARLIFTAAESARVYILPMGCIENYYVKNKIDYMPVYGKDKLFHEERNSMLAMKPEALRRIYAPLTDILGKALSKQ